VPTETTQDILSDLEYGPKGKQTARTKMTALGWNVTGETPAINKTARKEPAFEGDTDLTRTIKKTKAGPYDFTYIYETENHILKKEDGLKKSFWEITDKKTGKVIDRAFGEGGMKFLAEKYESRPVDVVQKREREEQQREVVGISFEQAMSEKGLLEVGKGDQVRFYRRNPETGKWYYPDNTIYLLLEKPTAKVPKNLKGKQFTVNSPIYVTYKLRNLSTNEEGTATIPPTEENVRLVLRQQGAWKYPKFFGEPVTEIEALVEEAGDDLSTELTEADLASLPKKDRERLAETITVDDLQKYTDEGRKQETLQRISEFYDRLENDIAFREEIEDAITRVSITRQALEATGEKRYRPFAKREAKIQTAFPAVGDNLNLLSKSSMEAVEEWIDNSFTVYIRKNELPSATKSAEEERAATKDLQNVDVNKLVAKGEADRQSTDLEEGIDEAGPAKTPEEAERKAEEAGEIARITEQQFRDDVYVKKTYKTDETLYEVFGKTDAEVTKIRAAVKRAITGRLDRRQKGKVRFIKKPETERDDVQIDTLDPETGERPTPETTRVKVRPSVAKEKGLEEGVFYPWEDIGTVPQWNTAKGDLSNAYLKVAGQLVLKTDIIGVEQRAPTKQLRQANFIEVVTPDTIPNPETVDKVFVDRRTGVTVVKRKKDEDVEFDPAMLSPISDVEVYITFTNKQEHEAKVEALRDALMPMARETEGKVRPIKRVVNTTDNKKFLTTDLAQSLRGGRVTAVVKPNVLYRVNKIRKSKGLKPIKDFKFPFEVSQHSLRSYAIPKGIERGVGIKEFGTLPFFGKGRKGFINISDGSNIITISADSVLEATQTAVVPELIGAMASYEALVEAGPERGSRLVASYNLSPVSRKGDIPKYNEFVDAVFGETAHRYGMFGTDRERLQKARSESLSENIGNKAMFEMYDGSVVSGVISYVNANSVGIKVDGKLTGFDVLNYQRVQVVRPEKPIEVREGAPIEDIGRPDSMLTYYPFKEETVDVERVPVFGSAVSDEQTIVRVYYSKLNNTYSVSVDGTKDLEGATADQTAAFLNNLDKVTEGEFKVRKLPEGLKREVRRTILRKKDVKVSVPPDPLSGVEVRYKYSPGKEEAELGITTMPIAEPELSKKVKDLRASGKSFSSIAKKLGISIEKAQSVFEVTTRDDLITPEIAEKYGAVLSDPDAAKKLADDTETQKAAQEVVDKVAEMEEANRKKREEQAAPVETTPATTKNFTPEQFYKGPPLKSGKEAFDVLIQERDRRKSESPRKQFRIEVDLNSLNSFGLPSIKKIQLLYSPILRRQPGFKIVRSATTTLYSDGRKVSFDFVKKIAPVEVVTEPDAPTTEEALMDDLIDESFEEERQTTDDVPTDPEQVVAKPITGDTPFVRMDLGQSFEDKYGGKWKVTEKVSNVVYVQFTGGKAPDLKFQAIVHGKKDVTKFSKGMTIEVDRMSTPNNMSVRISYDNFETDFENYSIVRPIPADGQGSFKYNTGLTPKRFKEVLGSTVGRLNLERLIKSGEVIIVQNQQDVPFNLINMGVHAVTRNGKTWFITNNIKESEITGLYLHEIGVHLGMKQVYGDDFNSILNEVKSRRNNPEWADAFDAATISANQKTFADDVARENYISEEAFAYFVESNAEYKNSFWQIIFDTLKRVAARFQMYIGKPVSDGQLIAFARGAARGMSQRNNQQTIDSDDEEYYSLVQGAADRILETEGGRKLHDAAERAGYTEKAGSAWRATKKFFDPFANLPFARDLRKLRSLLAGKMGEIESLGRDILKAYDNLTEEQNQELFEFFTTKGATFAENSTVDKQLQQASIGLKNKIEEIATEAELREMFPEASKEQLAELRGAYLPRVYLTNILSHSTDIGGKFRTTGKLWTMPRKEFDESVREMMGEIKDVKYLLYNALTMSQHDIVVIDYLKQLSVRSAIEESEALKKLKENLNQKMVDRDNATTDEQKTALDQDIKDLKKQIKDMPKDERSVAGDVPWVMPMQWVEIPFIKKDGTKGKRLTTLASLERQITAFNNLIAQGKSTMKPEAIEALKERSAELELARKEFYDSLGVPLDQLGTNQEGDASSIAKYYDDNYDLKMFRRIPNIPDKYGSMAGLYVRREIYEDIIGNADMVKGEQNLFQRMLLPYGKHAKLVSAFKILKVPLNPPTVVRNFVSNLVLMQLIGGVAFHRQPALLRAAIKEMRGEDSGMVFTHSKTGKKFTAYELAQEQGVSGTTLTSAELKKMEIVFQYMEKEGAWGILTGGQKMWNKLAEFGGDLYQNIEILGKVAVIMDKLNNDTQRAELNDILAKENSKILTIEDIAVQEANRILFDYSEVSPTIRGLRSSFLGAPFITFQVKVLPELVKVLNDPSKYHRFIPYMMLIGSAQALFGSFPFVEDDWDKMEELLPEFTKDNTMLFLPWKDSEGRWQAVDISYFFPWSWYTQMATKLGQGDVSKALIEGGVIGPGWQLMTAITTNKDPWSGYDIVNENDPLSDRVFDKISYMNSMMLPPWLTRNGLVSVSSLGEAMYRLDPKEIEGKLFDFALGRTNRYGDTKVSFGKLLGSSIGLNPYAISPDARSAQNRRYNSEIRGFKADITSTRKNRSLAPDQKKRKVNELKRRIDEAREEKAEFNRKTSGIERTL
jgi:archaellum component FlaC